jgi:pilus assembly protein FimV
MRPSRLIPSLLCAAAVGGLVAAGLLWAPSAVALSLGGHGGSATLGQLLDITVPVRLEGGESLTSECVSADVLFGEQRLPASGVRSVVEGQGDAARIRVRSLLPVDEPIVTVDVGAGCGSRVTRRFVLPAAAPAATTGPLVRPITLPPLAATGLAADAPAPAVAAPVTQAPKTERTVRAAGAGAPTQRMASSISPRLRMDLVEPLPQANAQADASSIELAIQAVADATNAVRAVAEAASAAKQRAAALEVTVDQLRAQAKDNREATEQLQRRLVIAETASQWAWPLAGLCLVLGGLCLWLMGRAKAAAPPRSGPTTASGPSSEMGQSRNQGQPAPQSTSPVALQSVASPSAHAAHAALAAKPASTSSGPAQAQFSPPEAWLPTLDNEVTPSVLQALTARSHQPPESAVERTDPSLQSVPGRHALPRDVSIEELIDLEQQADFFVALGQDDAAVSLLTEHLRQTGGASPLPYLKLLEIHRRRDQREDYERARGRFNQRFNAYAPEWDVGLQSGRSLEDYAGVLPRLQLVWGKPLDGMAELEALLFRKSRGELFDLPAYRDVLFLYALARDLLDREGADTGSVDLLLPIGAYANNGAAGTLGVIGAAGLSPSLSAFDHPQAGSALSMQATQPAHLAAEHRATQDIPTAPLDFDLDLEHGRHTSIFDPVQGPPQGTRR